MTTRLFISAVTHEFRSCRERLSEDLRLPDVVAQNQEEYLERLAAGSSLLVKLDDYVLECDAVIHLIGEQISGDGRAASPEAVDDLLTRYPDFPSVVKLSEDGLRGFSYTQWEAWLAYYHIKKTNPNIKLIIATPRGDFLPDNPPEPGTASKQRRAQARHAQELRRRGRYSEIEFSDCKELSIQVLRALRAILPGQQFEQKIAGSRIASRHTSDAFLGREAELEWLDEAWFDAAAEQAKANVFAIIAWGGVGKTALLAEWVQTRFRSRGWKRDDGQPDPVFYFDWTFYDQGTRAGAASVDSFFDRALTFFDDPEPHRSGKGLRLARLIQQRRGLLVLDGLEPLQYPPNHPQACHIIDPDLHDLLAALAQNNPGLCLISSRQTIADLAGHLSPAAPQKSLEELPEPVATQLLRSLGVNSSDDDLSEAVRDYAGHALSLILLGRYLAVAKGGDIRKRDTIELYRANDQRNARTRNAWNVLVAYERWLASPDGRPADLQALRLLGLFDRPASPDCIGVLRREPAIASITDRLVPLADDEWNLMLQRLHDAQLIKLKFPEQQNAYAPRPEPREVPLDAHPLVREYFSRQIREREREAFKTAHSRLFEHLCRLAAHRPDSLQALQPLYQAVRHGCLAERQQETVEKVYCERIQRGTRDGGFYSSRKLGAIATNLAVISAFFEQPWTQLSKNLTVAYQDWLLNEAAYYLRGLGRLTEALEPMRVAMERRVAEGDFENAAAGAHNLSELEITLGKLDDALQHARNAIGYSDRSKTVLERMSTRAIAADALFQAGNREEARILFENAETVQREGSSQGKQLHSIWGFRFCELILAPAERAAWRQQIFAGTNLVSPSLNPEGHASADRTFEEAPNSIYALLEQAERRAMETLNWQSTQSMLLSEALDQLTLARVVLYRGSLSANKLDLGANPNLTVTLENLRKAGEIEFVAKALLAAAHWHAIAGDSSTAHQHLNEAQQIAERGPMPLNLADVHLHRARLFHDRGELTKAKTLIERHRYGRRLEELVDAETASRNW